MNNEIKPAILGNDHIRELLKSNKPFMAGKLGNTEKKIIKFRHNGIQDNTLSTEAPFSAGVTPPTNEIFDFFCDVYIDAIKNMDIFGSSLGWDDFEIINKYNSNYHYYGMRCLEAIYWDDPWSKELENKNVLVIHPFTESIKKQYAIKDKLFKNKKMLPEFNLLTYRAKQTNAGGMGDGLDYKTALNIMIEDIKKIDFDIALIGAGGHGLPLANTVKSMDKQAVTVGGGLQLLFGIKGGRWDNHEDISKLFNEYWIRPSQEERPINIYECEGACYW